MNVHLTRYGKGRPLVFFHGWGFDHHIWYPLIPYLDNSFQLILVDVPGFGRTDMQSWDAFKHHLLAQLPEEFALVGWSMGGLYATRLAIEAPERVAALCNIATSPRFIADIGWPGVSKEMFQGFYHRLSEDTDETLRAFIQLHAGTQSSELIRGVAPSAAGLESGLTLLEQWDLREGVHDLSCPTSYFFGRLDSIVPFATLPKMQEYYPNCHFVLFRRAAHMPFLSHTELFVDELLRFLS